MKLLDKMEKKFGKYSINNLMLYIVLLNALVYFLVYLNGNSEFVNNLYLIPQLVTKGEIWRLITFIAIPPSVAGIIGLFFSLYFNYISGIGLEHEWGSFKFNIYYLTGMLATIIISFITGVSTSGQYINMSLFLAFAMVYPDFELLLFFILPIKVKYLAILNLLTIGYNFIVAPSMAYRLLVLVPVINFLIFFGKDLVTDGWKKQKNYVRKQQFNSKVSKDNEARHKCTICVITEKDDPNMEFRYCSKCNGHYCYCMNHLKNHEHIK